MGGFTLIELMIVIAIIAIIAAIAIPNLLSARLNSNETAAIGSLRTVIAAQAAFQSTAGADGNGNGVGEYGTFAEMSGSAGVRSGAVMMPPVLSTAYRAVNADGEVAGHGYQFAIFGNSSIMRYSRHLRVVLMLKATCDGLKTNLPVLVRGFC